MKNKGTMLKYIPYAIATSLITLFVVGSAIAMSQDERTCRDPRRQNPSSPPCLKNNV